MELLASIQTAQKQYETGDHPVLLLCNDMNDYVCKYAIGSNCMTLLGEYIAASFLQLWQLPVPDFAFIQIDYEHVKDVGIPKVWIEKTAFGSKYNRAFVELNSFTDEPDLKKFNGYVENRDQLLKISLFDLWIANEDRNFNNPNLLIDVTSGYQFRPIDHGMIFNGRTFDSKMCLLTENESLVDTRLFDKLFGSQDFNKEYVRKLKEYFYLCTLECKRQIHEIINHIPPDWSQNISVLEQKLNNELFTQEWEARVVETFLNYINSPYL